MNKREPHLSKPDVLLMTICTGLIVANIYYCQPLIILIAKEFNISEATAGKINYLTQAGYAAGLFLLVPLGDMLERRKQILVTTLASVCALLLAATSRHFWLLQVACFLIGACSIVPQLILPLAANLSGDHERGKNIGTIMGGLLVGILASRALSGAIGQWLGWRAMLFIAAGICVTLMLIMAARFPTSKPRFSGNYKMLIRSMFGYIRSQPALREAATINFIAFAVITGFWTVMVLYLASPVYHFQALQIGLFGIAGAAGAMAAPLVGRFSDKSNPRKNLLIGSIVELISLALFYFWGSNLFLFIAGILLIDVAQQAIHITNQTRIYALVPEARNRLNTIFMSVSFVGAATGSAVGLVLWNKGGWPLFCIGCFILVVINILIYFIFDRRYAEKA
ncbi:MAG: MFS transporter [Niabella sp.]|nr:MFS transporter [Niabella sp.]